MWKTRCDRTMLWQHAASQKEFGKTKKCPKGKAHDLYVASPTYLENIKQSQQIQNKNYRGRRQNCKSFQEKLTEDASGWAHQMWPSDGKVWIDPLSWHRHEPQGIEQWSHKTRNEEMNEQNAFFSTKRMNFWKEKRKKYQKMPKFRFCRNVFFLRRILWEILA